MNIYQELRGVFDSSSRIEYKRNGKSVTYTYSDFLEVVDRVADFLLSKDVKRGDRVGIFLENTPEFVAIDLACFKIGAVVVPINSKFSSEVIDYIIRDSRCKIIFSNKNLESHADKLVLLEMKENFEDSFNLKEYNVVLKEEAGENDLATICYTSGSTGKPKGVMLTHGNLLHNIRNNPLDFKKGDSTVVFLPFNHMFGRTCALYFSMFRNVDIFLSEDITKVFEDIAYFKPTFFMTVPRLLEKFYSGIKLKLNEMKIPEGVYPEPVKELVKSKLGGKVRYMITGGAPINHKIINFFDDIGIEVYEGYGLTEFSPLISVNYAGNKMAGSVGRPISAVNVKISERGHLLVKSPGLMKGYTLKGEMEKRLIDGFFDTNDVCEINDGFIFIKGRADDLIILSNGKKTYPEAIEKKVESLGIDSCFIVGSAKSFLGALIYSDKDNQTIEEIMGEVNNTLSEHEKIRRWIKINEGFTLENGLMTHTMKKKRNKILEKYSKEIEGIYN